MKKNIKDFKQGDLIMLGQGAWTQVMGEPYTDVDGWVRLPVRLLGLTFIQHLRFDGTEEFEYEAGSNEQ